MSSPVLSVLTSPETVASNTGPLRLSLLFSYFWLVIVKPFIIRDTSVAFLPRRKDVSHERGIPGRVGLTSDCWGGSRDVTEDDRLQSSCTTWQGPNEGREVLSDKAKNGDREGENGKHFVCQNHEKFLYPRNPWLEENHFREELCKRQFCLLQKTFWYVEPSILVPETVVGWTREKEVGVDRTIDHNQEVSYHVHRGGLFRKGPGDVIPMGRHSRIFTVYPYQFRIIKLWLSVVDSVATLCYL